MKQIHMLFVVVFGVSSLFASGPTNDSNMTVDWSKAELNYKANLRSDNVGVKISAANFVRKYKLSGAVDELKELLSKDNADNVKMSAALALLSVGGEDGRTSVEKALENEENEIVSEFYRSVLHTAVISER
ncbi:MAG: hypothetical protein ACOYNS_09215 [Bacteroidota bacterium]